MPLMRFGWDQRTWLADLIEKMKNKEDVQLEEEEEAMIENQVAGENGANMAATEGEEPEEEVEEMDEEESLQEINWDEDQDW